MAGFYPAVRGVPGGTGLDRLGAELHPVERYPDPRRDDRPSQAAASRPQDGGLAVAGLQFDPERRRTAGPPDPLSQKS